MWIFARYGFYSIACASKPRGPLDRESLMIRARCRAHLENLQKPFPELAASEVLTWPHRDYRYRIIVAKSVWALRTGGIGSRAGLVQLQE
jgi:hypothetical protein